MASRVAEEIKSSFCPRFLEGHVSHQPWVEGSWRLGLLLLKTLLVVVLISGSGSGLSALLGHQQGVGCTHKTVMVITTSRKRGPSACETPSSPTCQYPSLRSFRIREAKGARVAGSGCYSEIGGRTGGSLGVHENLDIRLRISMEGRLVQHHTPPCYLFSGAHAHRDVLNAGEDISGCTVHLVGRRHWADTSSADGARSEDDTMDRWLAYQEGGTRLVSQCSHRLCSDAYFDIGWGVEID